jgi:c-di-GMP-binding flagellar brake protein YcgR
MNIQKRRYTRSKAWPDTMATIKVQDSFGYNKIHCMTVTGQVEDLGCSGMFFISEEFVPVPGYAEIIIHFDSNPEMSDMAIKASGRTVRLNKKGVGIRFTSINLEKLQKCIIQKINHSDFGECLPYNPA